jgi:hypothetical protein
VAKLYGSSLGSNPDISQKYKMGDISKGVACQKIFYKNKIWVSKNSKFDADFESVEKNGGVEGHFICCPMSKCCDT